MGNDGSGRRSPWDLFAERQVHMRSGNESRYVVLSRPLQIGVAAGFLAILGAARDRILQRDRQAPRAGGAAARTGGAAGRERGAGRPVGGRAGGAAAAATKPPEREIEQLTAALDQAQAERMEAVTASSAAGANAAELEGALVATTQESQQARGRARRDARVRRCPAGPRVRAGICGHAGPARRGHRPAGGARAGEPRGRSAAPHGDPGTAGAGRARRAAARSRRCRRHRRGHQAATPPRQLALTAAPASDAVRRLQQDLADAQATVADAERRSRGPQRDRARARPPMRLPSWPRSRSRSASAHRRAEQLGASLARQPASAATPRPLPADCPGRCSAPALAAGAALTRSARATG